MKVLYIAPERRAADVAALLELVASCGHLWMDRARDHAAAPAARLQRPERGGRLTKWFRGKSAAPAGS